MKLSRRVELVLGCGAFVALGVAFCAMAGSWWSTGVMRLTPLFGRVGGAAGAALAALYALVGLGAILAAALFLRARWTPPVPGSPVEPSPDRT